ncbi:hypothetical protein [Phenylobacterium sp.]|uniref:hypothetical protein n=1 Tax=Phenylobacterium sp. TaxID=1871053 RepID=UPI0025DAD741|nr:hypothetical protein [Phenylobacterium sp.]MCA6346851.1 hypothetical protein [Phenylobacterium sp.]MCA6351708.1 hypothetical protein [Phenylobacterium sp.]MCA6355302.1 hypothetical protein [Phenylobacterium sp.]MCA6358314.1 hypothetical protein [Phenylobacterium sp.]MCA6361191.1 hypothetical protein [Phenylobacterium sp.]
MSRRPRGTFSPRQSRAARGLLGWSPEELARRSHLEAEGVELFEAGEGVLSEADADQLGDVLVAAGVIALQERMAGEGVRFRAPDAPSLPTAAPWWPAPRPPGASAPPPQLAAVNDDAGEDEDDDSSDFWGEEVDEFEREDG